VKRDVSSKKKNASQKREQRHRAESQEKISQGSRAEKGHKNHDIQTRQGERGIGEEGRPRGEKVVTVRRRSQACTKKEGVKKSHARRDRGNVRLKGGARSQVKKRKIEAYERENYFSRKEEGVLAGGERLDLRGSF